MATSLSDFTWHKFRVARCKGPNRLAEDARALVSRLHYVRAPPLIDYEARVLSIRVSYLLFRASFHPQGIVA